MGRRMGEKQHQKHDPGRGTGRDSTKRGRRGSASSEVGKSRRKETTAEHFGHISTKKELESSPSRSVLRLYTIDEVPSYLCDNASILTGYRMNYTTEMCVRSVFALHNETFNIWTHLFGFVVFVVVITFFFVGVLVPSLFHHQVSSNGVQSASQLSRDSLSEYRWPTLIVFAALAFGALTCMLCSATFHTLIPHECPTVYRWAHVLDYFGITFMVVGSFLPMCYMCFACTPSLKWGYMGMIFFFGIGGILGPCFRSWTDPSYMRFKIAFYVCMVGSGLIPITHIYLILPLNISTAVVEGLLLMMVLYGVGVVVYVFQVPEVFYPGRFDIYLSSHQLWHIFVLAAALVHFFNCAAMYVNMHSLPLNC
uniref:Adiponectin receptor protein 1 n=1 Tax=Trypanosoma congolense (strain IL3000) TaxID=1068625 RepID=G0UXB5_TRYCI|nr:conserved hypothetical protein [Trypanosoma congolense IL3000]